MVYEIDVLNTKYLGLERAGLLWFNIAIWKEPELTSFQRNTESTAINRTISSGGETLQTGRATPLHWANKREATIKQLLLGPRLYHVALGASGAYVHGSYGAAPNEQSVLKQLSPLVP